MQFIPKHTRSYTDCIKMVQAEKIILDMILVQNVCVINILLKRNNCSS